MFIQMNALETLVPNTGKKALLIHCHHGMLWLTRTGNKKDFIVEAGGMLEVPGGGKIVIMALDKSLFSIQKRCQGEWWLPFWKVIKRSICLHGAQ